MDPLVDRIASLSQKQLAVLALELRDRLARAEAARTEPIAVVGMSCRLPGGVDDPDRYWGLLVGGADVTGEVPRHRWPAGALDGDGPAGGVGRRGGFLPSVDGFDAAFFGISGAEAAAMDPQQRLFLELAWEALERGGQPADELAGTPVGVFAGVSSHDYADLKVERGPCAVDAHYATGNAVSLVAGRLSYLLGLEGPAVVVDTACSSSLVAVHLACQSLRAGECDLALAGGVNLMLTPAMSVFLARAGVLAGDGRCKAFDAKADGYVRGEGGGVVALRRLSDALARRDPVAAVIRGSAVGQDGRSNGLRAPNGAALEGLLRRCLRAAGVEARDVDYVEAHGTGTLLGDMIEATALGRVLGGPEREGRPLLLGSVKTNLGHLEAAAGITSLIKVVLALQHRQIPPSLHFEEPNPHVPFADLSLSVVTRLADWPAAGRPARAGVGSLSWSGTNAHVLLEEAPPPAPRATRPPGPQLLTLSARSPEALLVLARAVGEVATSGEGDDEAAWLHGACATAAARRSHHAHRLALVARSRADLAAGLDAFVRGAPWPGLAQGRQPANRKPALLWLFAPVRPGDWGSAVEAFAEREPAFGRAYRAMASALGLAPWSARRRGADAEDAPRRQVAAQVGLAALSRSWGLMPQSALGVGAGEVAAACAAGVLSAEDGARALAAQLGARSAGAVGVEGLRPQPGDVALRSSATGEVVAGERFDAAHWSRGPAASGRLAELAAGLGERGPRRASLVLLHLGAETPEVAALARPSCEVVAALGGADDVGAGPEAVATALLAAAGKLYVLGCVSGRHLMYGEPAPAVALPTYPWQRQRHWLDGAAEGGGP